MPKDRYVHVCLCTYAYKHAANTHTQKKFFFAIQRPELNTLLIIFNRQIIYQFYYYTTEFLCMISNINTDAKKDRVYIQQLALKLTFRL
jgi:hypothetical protein